MSDWTPEQLADQKAICGCGHFKNTHAQGEASCLFSQIQAAYGFVSPECPCRRFSQSAELSAVFEIKSLVLRFFGHTEKADLWFKTPNPLLGGIAPATMIAAGREKRLLQFVQTQLSENDCSAGIVKESP